MIYSFFDQNVTQNLTKLNVNYEKNFLGNIAT